MSEPSVSAPTVRFATPDDTDELVRLRRVMLRSMGVSAEDGPWVGAYRLWLSERLGTDDVFAAVIDSDEPARLAAVGLGLLHDRVPAPWNPSPTEGKLFSMSTDTAYRRRGYGRLVLEALLRRFHELGANTVRLQASPDAEALYRARGFTDVWNDYPHLVLNLEIDPAFRSSESAQTR